MEPESLIELLEYERKKLNNYFEQVHKKDSNAQITSEMNLNQLIGHISWYENKIVEIIQNKGEKAHNSEFDYISEDEKNKKIALLYRYATFEEIKAGADDIFSNLIKLLKNVTKEQLEDRNILKDPSNERLPWQVLIENSFIHYEEHIAIIKKWLNRC